ncbi:hypothetical protein GDO78_019852 [Eleutherodactylus coqui]|uniref:Secreted protein n=1 Tax=Eleutherodactylus coqui TaxID=57060 RepID=A0A8J6E5K0_ELECQ|nr:hypothetical protein GDO78_019852 [Eleutherodactylus coqui]
MTFNTFLVVLLLQSSMICRGMSILCRFTVWPAAHVGVGFREYLSFLFLTCHVDGPGGSPSDTRSTDFLFSEFFFPRRH